MDAATNKYIGVYELDSNNKVVKFKLITVTADQINTDAAPILGASASAGAVNETTKITASVSSGNHLAIKVSSVEISIPNIGDAVPIGEGVTNVYTSGSDISSVDAVTNKYIGVYELDSNNKVVKFRQIILTANEINNKAAELNVTIDKGITNGSTKITASVSSGNHLGIKVSSVEIPIPNIGDAAPTGSGVTNAYTSGNDISGVDAATNKYIGVYELDNNNKVVKFKLITVTAGQINTDTAPVLEASAGIGTINQSTKVIASASSGNHVGIKVSSVVISIPNIGDPAPIGEGVMNPYSSKENIPGVDVNTNKYIGVYELNGSNEVVKFKLITLTANEINTSVAPEPIVTVNSGKERGTTSISATPVIGNHLAIKISGEIIDNPNKGEVAPTGFIVMNPYASGADISGIDASINKYIGVYELDSNNKIVKFKLIILEEKDINTIAVPTLEDVNVQKGTGSKTTKITATISDGNHLVIKVSAGVIAIPNEGMDAPEGEGVIENYTLGDDIPEVDAAAKKYIGVYEVDSTNKIVKFKLITLTAEDIQE